MIVYNKGKPDRVFGMYKEAQVMAFTPEQIKEALNAPFDESQIKYREGAYGKSLAYLDGPTVYDRLNQSTNSWSFEISKSYFDQVTGKGGEPTRLMVVEGHLEIPELGKRAGTGVQLLRPGSGEDMYKGARTDAIKNAASLFGVGLHLYSDISTDSSERGYGMNQQTAPYQDDYGYDGPRDTGNYGNQQPQQQQGGYQRATGDRVPGGATVKQIGAIKGIASSKNIPDDDIMRMVAQETGGEMSYDALNSKGASNIIGHLNSL